MAIFLAILNMLLLIVLAYLGNKIITKRHKEELEAQREALLGIFQTDLNDYEKTWVMQSRLIRQGHKHCCKCFRVSGMTYKNDNGERQKIQLLNFQKDKMICSDCKKMIEEAEAKKVTKKEQGGLEVK